jgi:hypothetical protein
MLWFQKPDHPALPEPDKIAPFDAQAFLRRFVYFERLKTNGKRNYNPTYGYDPDRKRISRKMGFSL